MKLIGNELIWLSCKRVNLSPIVYWIDFSLELNLFLSIVPFMLLHGEWLISENQSRINRSIRSQIFFVEKHKKIKEMSITPAKLSYQYWKLAWFWVLWLSKYFTENVLKRKAQKKFEHIKMVLVGLSS